MFLIIYLFIFRYRKYENISYSCSRVWSSEVLPNLLYRVRSSEGRFIRVLVRRLRKYMKIQCKKKYGFVSENFPLKQFYCAFWICCHFRGNKAFFFWAPILSSRTIRSWMISILLLAGPSGIRVRWGIKQWQIRDRKAPNFGWATFGWVSCNLCPLCIALDLVA